MRAGLGCQRRGGIGQSVQLIIDTSTRYAAVGLSVDGEVIAHTAWLSQQNHSVELIPAIQRLMESRDVEIDDLSAVFAARGPGAFSALRVGLSTAKAMAITAELPLVSIGTLEVELHPYRNLGSPAWAVIDAGRDMLYLGRSAGAPSDAADEGYEVMTLDEISEAIPEGTLLCGEAAGTRGEWVRENLGDRVRIAPITLPSRHPGTLATLANERLRHGDVDDADMLQPIYIRGSQFEIAHRRWVS